MVKSLHDLDLSNSVAIITGGAGLLGLQHARALLSVDASVVIADVDQSAMSKAITVLHREFPDARLVSMEMDVSNIDSVQSVHKALLKQFDKVDILINNAAIDPKVKRDNQLLESSRVENFSLEQWDFQISVGLTGAFLCSQVFGTYMASHDGGVILNIASDLSVIAPDNRLYRRENVSEQQQPVKPITYSVIKTGLIGMTRYLAAYWADKNIRVNALSPAGVYHQQPEEFITRLTDLIPMGRMANVDEYNNAIQFLCSDASSYMTGQNIVMDGGRSII